MSALSPAAGKVPRRSSATTGLAASPDILLPAASAGKTFTV